MEFALIDEIARRTTLARDDVRLGIGDDAAVLAVPPGMELAVAVDTMVEGVHFLPGQAPFDLGWKALAVNLSDLAAMGAEPAWALLALTLPTAWSGAARAAFVDGFADGFAALAGEHRVALVGGDTTGGPLAMSVTVHGFVPPGQALRRAAAQVGDAVLVTGTLGDAVAALHLLRRNAARPDDAPLLARMHRPTPRVAAGLALRGRAHACQDISDGLLADLGHICTASHVGAVVDVEALPRSPALRARFGEPAARGFALECGDDYELVFTAPEPDVDAICRALRPLGGATRIGRIVAGDHVEAHDAQGRLVEPAHRGWDHFA